MGQALRMVIAYLQYRIFSRGLSKWKRDILGFMVEEHSRLFTHSIVGTAGGVARVGTNKVDHAGYGIQSPDSGSCGIVS